MKKTFFFLLLTATLCTKVFSQADSIIVQSRDTISITSYAQRYDPRKALLFAAVVPGLGQVYNKKYWKLPLVYGGFIAVGYNIKLYQDGYVKYKTQLFQSIAAPSNSTNGLTTDQLRRIVDRYRRERDLWVILMGGMYLLQMIDAHVDAHLKEFDLNPKLQVRVRPSAEQDAMLGRQTGVSVTIRF